MLKTAGDVSWRMSGGTTDPDYSGNMSHSSAEGSWFSDLWTGDDFYFRVWVGNEASEDVNHAPVIPEAGISADSSLIPVGAPVNVTADFTDEDAGDSHTATWQWTQDDPLDASAGAVSGTTVTGSHIYTRPGVYEVTLRVVDAVGARRSNTSGTWWCTIRGRLRHRRWLDRFSCRRSRV